MKYNLYFNKVEGKENWSWAEIKPNWIFNKDNPPTINLFKEDQMHDDDIIEVIADQIGVPSDNITYRSNLRKDINLDIL